MYPAGCFKSAKPRRNPALDGPAVRSRDSLRGGAEARPWGSPDPNKLRKIIILGLQAGAVKLASCLATGKHKYRFYFILFFIFWGTLFLRKLPKKKKDFNIIFESELFYIEEQKWNYIETNYNLFFPLPIFFPLPFHQFFFFLFLERFYCSCF